MPQLKLDKFSVYINHKLIIADVSLVLKNGESLVVVGPNGSGKSSLAMGVAGIPGYKTKGNVRLDKKNLSVLSSRDRVLSGLFLAWQNPVAIPNVKVVDYLWAVYQSVSPIKNRQTLEQFVNRVRQLLVKYHIRSTALEATVNDELSGGEKKKLQLIELEIIQPKFAILDELDSGLDISAQKVITREIRAILRLKIGFIVITHNLSFAKLLNPKKVMVIKGGEVVKVGSKKIISDISRHGYEVY